MSILSKTLPPLPPVRVVFGSDDIQEISVLISGALNSGVLTQGPLVKRFEADFSPWVDQYKAVAVNSATSGLEIILRLLKVAGREVVVPADTFVATAAAARHAGAEVKFADVELETFGLDPGSLAKAVTPRTAAVILVHIGGFISRYIDEIRDLCRRRGVFLIEDAAQALGSRRGGRPAGTFGIAGAFSFFATKIVTTGEGGMIVTADDKLRRRALILRNHGKNNQEECVEIGHNWRLSEINAALGIVQLRKLAAFLSVKKKIAAYYDAHLAGLPGLTIREVEESERPNYYKYIILLAPEINKAAFKARMRQVYNIALSGDVFPRTCPSLPVFKQPESYPRAEDFCRRHVCLPIYPDMSLAEAERVVTGVKASLKNKTAPLRVSKES